MQLYPRIDYWEPSEKLVIAEVRNTGNGCILGDMCGEPTGPTVDVLVRVRLFKTPSEPALASLDVPVDALQPEETRTILADFTPLANAGNGFLNEAREAVVTIDPDNEFEEFVEDNNEVPACVRPYETPARVCWFVDRCYVKPADVDLVVRTVNAKQSWSRYGQRLQGIVHQFYIDWRYQGGITGMQEMKSLTTTCPVGPDGYQRGTECFARLIGDAFDAGWSWTQIGQVGVVASSPWTMTSYDGWEIGKDGLQHLGSRSTRYLSEMVLRHDSNGWVLRVYSTHLSHGDQLDQRHDQLDKLWDIIKNRPQEGELPPVLVGDFNFKPENESSSFNKLKSRFHLINSQAIGCYNNKPTKVGIDQIWVGKKSAFPKTKRTLVPLRYITDENGSGIDLQSSGLSDHNAPGFEFAVLDEFLINTFPIPFDHLRGRFEEAFADR